MVPRHTWRPELLPEGLCEALRVVVAVGDGGRATLRHVALQCDGIFSARSKSM